jgi:SWI/SNF-related matrix-associated actin-dependent regulator of chromatin subfamily A member 5
MQKLQGYIVPSPDPKKGSVEEAEAERADEQAEIDGAEPLTEEEQAEKEELMKQGFNDWHKREYQGFIRGCEKYGRNNFEAIAAEIGTNKTAEDVKEYSEVFWDRYKEIEDWERQINKILESEKQHAKNERLTQLLRDTVAKYKYPLQQLSITHPLSSRPRAYSDEEDRFIVCALARHGVGSDDVYEKIKKEILEWPGFRFDWFIKSRTPIEIGRRCSTLISLVQKEHAPEQAAIDPARKARGRKKGELNGDADGKAAGKKRENGDTGSDAGSAPPANKVSLRFLPLDQANDHDLTISLPFLQKQRKSGLTSRASSAASSSRANSALPR